MGNFEAHGDVGTVVHPGTTEYDAATKTYTIMGSGNNMWMGEDDFQFAWKKMSGDVTLSANISFLGLGSNPHRKGVLMVRQTLDADSVYVDAALHGNGLTALQYRDEKGATTKDIESGDLSTQWMRLEKRGDFFYLYVSGGSAGLHPAGASIRIPFKETFTSASGSALTKKILSRPRMFSNVEVALLPRQLPANPFFTARWRHWRSLPTAGTFNMSRLRSSRRRTGRVMARRFCSIVTRIQNMPVEGGPIRIIDTSFAVQCNNDHGFSPEGALLAISDNSKEDHKSLVSRQPSTGGSPRRITQKSPSYWHGWSPDGQTLAFVGERNGEFDIYTIPTAGGEETQLTTAPGLDDGPEYSPDGKYIYFTRSARARCRSGGCVRMEASRSRFS